MKNIYIHCLQRGFENKNGVTYRQIKNEIIDKFKMDFTPEFELGFRIWFFENFYEPDAEMRLVFEKNELYELKIDTKTGIIPFEEYIDSKVYLKGEATLKYLDYLELIDARKSSKQAFLFSIISIMIAICAIFMQAFLKTELKQPIEVILIDQNKNKPEPETESIKIINQNNSKNIKSEYIFGKTGYKYETSKK